MEPRAIKIPDKLWETLGRVGEDLGYTARNRRGAHSRLVREMVSAAVTKWEESPYVARSAKHVALVTRDGHLFYRQVQVLKLNKGRDRLPCLLDLHASRRADARETEWVEPRWLLNYFAAWQRADAAIGEDEPLDQWVDRQGTDAKIADLHVNQEAERMLTREIVAGLQGYVQWKAPRQLRADRRTPNRREHDRVNFPIDIPTVNLEIVVAVDADLYRATARTEAQRREIADLKLELRNRELARFEDNVFWKDDFNPLRNLDGKFLGQRAESEGETTRRRTAGPEAAVRKALEELKGRLEALIDVRVKDHEVVPNKKALREALKLPDSYLYYTLEWPSPYFGVEVGIQWEKPELTV